MSLFETLLSIERAEIGVTEQPLGSNWGPRVAQYIRSAGYNEPVFWCLCFQFWAIQEACREAGETNPLPRTGSCDLLLDWARRQNALRTSPEPGDLFLILKNPADAIHTGLVTAATENQIETIEGNSNNDGSRNGTSVVERTRARSESIAYVRWLRISEQWRLTIDDKSFGAMPLFDGQSYAPVRALLKARGRSDSDLVWHAEDASADIGGKRIPGGRIIDARGYVPIRAAVAALGLAATFDARSRSVDISTRK